MCATCGCGHAPLKLAPSLNREQNFAAARLLKVEQDLLQKNNDYAAENRNFFKQRNILVLNFVASPGAGKTSILLATINSLKEAFPIAVIEGDQQTEHDAERIRATGIPAYQINTGRICHLDAKGIGQAAQQLDLQAHSLLVIENIGNLVCPAAFDLGEAHKVVVLSVTEGDDKPIKYPDMFQAADVMLINKTDLLPYVDFDIARCRAYARQVNPDISIICLSARTGENFNVWCEWLQARHATASL